MRLCDWFIAQVRLESQSLIGRWLEDTEWDTVFRFVSFFFISQFCVVTVIIIIITLFPCFRVILASTKFSVEQMWCTLQLDGIDYEDKKSLTCAGVCMCMRLAHNSYTSRDWSELLLSFFSFTRYGYGCTWVNVCVWLRRTMHRLHTVVSRQEVKRDSNVQKAISFRC